MSSNELVKQGNLFSATSAAAVAGVAVITTTAYTFFQGTSKILGLKVAGGVLTAPLYIRSIVFAANTGVATITVNSSSGAGGETGTCTLYWENTNDPNMPNA